MKNLYSITLLFISLASFSIQSMCDRNEKDIDGAIKAYLGKSVNVENDAK